MMERYDVENDNHLTGDCGADCVFCRSFAVKESLVVSVALTLACMRLVKCVDPGADSDIVKWNLRAEVMQWVSDDEPMTPKNINLMALRFACEALSEHEGIPANEIEDDLLRELGKD